MNFKTTVIIFFTKTLYFEGFGFYRSKINCLNSCVYRLKKLIYLTLRGLDDKKCANKNLKH